MPTCNHALTTTTADAISTAAHTPAQHAYAARLRAGHAAWLARTASTGPEIACAAEASAQAASNAIRFAAQAARNATTHDDVETAAEAAQDAAEALKAAARAAEALARALV